MNTIDDILYRDIIPTLTDLANDQSAFHEAFKKYSIKNVLELGVYWAPGMDEVLYGQSTKILLALCKEYNASRMVSVDIDPNASKTIARCKRWLVERDYPLFQNHEFIVSNSIMLDVGKLFPAGADLIFLDTNHDDNYPERIGLGTNTGGAGMTYRELCHYAPFLSEQGSLFIHDTKNYYVPRAYGMNTEGAVQRFLDENPNFTFKEHGLNRHGLGELRHK